MKNEPNKCNGPHRTRIDRPELPTSVRTLTPNSNGRSQLALIFACSDAKCFILLRPLSARLSFRPDFFWFVAPFVDSAAA